MHISLEKSKTNEGRKIENSNSGLILSNSNWKLYSQNQRWNPPTDVFETDEQIIIRIEIAGMEEDDFDITFDKNIFSVTGSRIDQVRSVKVFHQMEVNFGEFFTGIEINIPLDIDNAEARYNNGFLSIFINKASPKTIKIGK